MIKKFKVHKSNCYIKKGLKLALGAGILPTSIVLTGCEGGILQKEEPKPNKYLINDEDYPLEEVDYEALSNSYYNLLIQQNVELNTNAVSTCKSEIASVQNDYPYSEYLNLDKELERYSKNVTITTEQTTSINFDNFYEKVKNNTAKFLENQTGTKYFSIDDENLKNICKMIENSINYELENSYVATGNLQKKMDELVIVGYSEFSFADYCMTTNVLSVSLPSIETIPVPNGLLRIIKHETHHMLQANDISNNYGISYGIGYDFNNPNINPLYQSWFIEGAAESLSMRECKTTQEFIYQKNLNMLRTIKASNILNEDLYALEAITLQNDINKLYEYFNAETYEEQKEVLEMLYFSNVVATSSDRNYLFRELAEHNVEYDGDYLAKVYGGCVSVTLAKSFYKNLLNSSNLTLKDYFSLIKLFETSLIHETDYANKYTAKDLEDFYRDYVEIQDSFFKLLATSLNLNESDVCIAYMMYSRSYNGYISNSFLNMDANNLGKQILNCNGLEKNSIREYDMMFKLIQSVK